MAKQKRKRKHNVVEIDVQEVDKIIDATADGPLSEERREKLRAWVHAMIAELRTKKRPPEKLEQLLKELDDDEAGAKDAGEEPPADPRKKGNRGRRAAAEFRGAKKVQVPHQELQRADRCPGCEKGRLYPVKPKTLLRFVGNAPVQATVYELESLRCNLCGEVFTADSPDGVGTEKYDETVASILALLTYGSGFPRYRLAGLQERLGIPLPQNTQWDILLDAAKKLDPIHARLTWEAAQAEVLYHDDTARKILKLARPPDDSRTGVHTTGIVATGTGEGPRIAIFLTGRQHAGENMRDVLTQRSAELSEPITMSDALSRNQPKDHQGTPLDVVPAHCLAHGRRYFVGPFENFPEECKHVLEELALVFAHDQNAKEKGLGPEERLAYHQKHSQPVMERLHAWLSLRLEENLVEANSGLGKAIRYLLKHWQKLTLFLRKAGAPLDNNTAERGLKKAVMHRKNSLFYRTQRGANVGDLFMSLVYSCELNDINPFVYLTVAVDNTRPSS